MRKINIKIPVLICGIILLVAASIITTVLVMSRQSEAVQRDNPSENYVGNGAENSQATESFPETYDSQDSDLVETIYSMVVEVMSPRYDAIWSTWASDELFIVGFDIERNDWGWIVGGKWGVIDVLGNEIVPPIFDEALVHSNGIITVRIDSEIRDGSRRGGRQGIFDIHGNEISPPIFDEVIVFSNGMMAVRVDSDIDEAGWFMNGRWGFLDMQGNEIVPPIYDNIGGRNIWDFDSGFMAVNIGWEQREGGGVVNGGQWGFIDIYGNEIVPPMYDEVDGFSEGLARVNLGGRFTGRWGFIDTHGQEVIPLIYNEMRWQGQWWTNGLAVVRVGTNEWDYLHSENTGEVIGVERVGNAKWGVIDMQGNEIILPRYDLIMLNDDGTAVVGIDFEWRADEWGFIRDHWDNLISGRVGIIDIQGNYIVPPTAELFDFLMSLEMEDRIYDGILSAILVEDRETFTGKWGLLDTHFNVVVPFIYDRISPVWSYDGVRTDSGLAIVELDGNWGLIDMQGNEIAPLLYDDIQTFGDGLVRVQIGGSHGILDKQGNEIVSVRYDGIVNISNRMIAVGNATGRVDSDGDHIVDSWGFVDMQGSEIAPMRYNAVWGFENFALVGIGNRETGFSIGVLNINGVGVAPIEHDSDGAFVVHEISRGRGINTFPFRYNDKWGLGRVE